MNEHYLQQIWNLKRLPFHLLETTDGRKLEILSTGFWNHQSGPDFFAGKILIDGIVLHGNIEIHVKASDWLKHGHQYDSAYDNVILHVVYEADLPITLHGEIIPTVCLKPFIDWKHFKLNQQALNRSPLTCVSTLPNVPAVFFWGEVEKCAWSRIERKSQQFTRAELITDFKEQLFRFLAISFGMKINNLAFEELAHRIPLKYFLKAKTKQKVAICLGVSGLMDKYPSHTNQFNSEWQFQATRLNLHSMQASAWKTKGHRPQGFPDKRLIQFAYFIDNMDWSADFWNNEPRTILHLLQQHLMKRVRIESMEIAGMSRATANVVIANSVVPFLWWLAVWKKEAVFKEKAFSILELLPAESNEIISIWKENQRVPENALESQGLLELFHTKCQKKECLNCTVGKIILKVSD